MKAPVPRRTRLAWGWIRYGQVIAPYGVKAAARLILQDATGYPVQAAEALRLAGHEERRRRRLRAQAQAFAGRLALRYGDLAARQAVLFASSRPKGPSRTRLGVWRHP
jgi:hypothetical protein